MANVVSDIPTLNKPRLGPVKFFRELWSSILVIDTNFVSLHQCYSDWLAVLILIFIGIS